MLKPRMSPAFLEGVRVSLPFFLVLIPFGMLFGVLAVEAGASVAQTLGFSTFVIAGASQFTAVQMLSDHATLLLIILASLTVNLRMVMYSASLGPYLGSAPLWQRALASYGLFDHVYVLCIAKYDAEPMLVQERMAFFFGLIVLSVPLWVITTYVGVIVGTAIPPEYGLDFALPITFIASVVPMIRTMAHAASAVSAVCFGLLFSSLPAGIGLLCAALIAMVVGVCVETLQERRHAAL